jgi:hypothetical protein
VTRSSEFIGARPKEMHWLFLENWKASKKPIEVQGEFVHSLGKVLYEMLQKSGAETNHS